MSIPIALPDYAELHCQSYFSFLQGASAPEALVERAHELGYRALALTDECSMAGVVRAHSLARQRSVKLVLGSTFAVHEEHASPGQTDGIGPWRVTILATDRSGYEQLCEAISRARARAGKGSYRMYASDLEPLQNCLVIALAPPSNSLAQLQNALTWLTPRFASRLWVAQSLLLHAHQASWRSQVQRMAEQFGLPCVATGMVLMARRQDKPLQDVVTAIRLGQPVAQCGYALAPNAEQHLRSRLRLAQMYPAQWLTATIEIAERCQFSLESLRYEYPQEIVPTGYTPNVYLREQTWLGAQKRYPKAIPKAVHAQIERELGLIAELDYACYFLTVYDVVRFARQSGILCQGRGSAANSAVCYCLGITEVDPLNGNLLFERFISRERNEPPDIDVDFEHHRREEVIQYIYTRYGRDRAALTAVAITYRPRSALRDVGKALGVDAGVIDHVARSVAWWERSQALDTLHERLPVPMERAVVEQWITLSRALLGSVRHLSQHPGGFVLSQKRLSSLVPIEPASMPGRSVVQWDKDDLDTLGLMKVDVLALGMLTAIRRALAYTAWRRGLPMFRMQDIARDDRQTFEMISNADTVGVFQIESRAQMSMLPRLRPACFYDLVVEVAIVRPGPIQGGMVHPYLRRRQGLEPVTYPSPAIEKVLQRTLGVPIFQEQVMSIAMVAAGFTAGEADSLRRAMAAWRRKGGLEPFQDRLISGLLANGYDPSFARAVYQQIEGFAEYGFPESHAASFAWLAYVSAWLKCHEPEAFLAALLNSQPMGFYTPSQLIQDAQRHGVEVLPVDVQHSEWLCTLAYRSTPVEADHAQRPAVRLGLNQIKGLQAQSAMRIVRARQDCPTDRRDDPADADVTEAVGNQRHQEPLAATRAARPYKPFQSVQDLALRAQLDRGSLEQLAAAGALASLTRHRHHAMWEVADAPRRHNLLTQAESAMKTPVDLVAPSFIDPPSPIDDLVADYAQLGYTLGAHPLSYLRRALGALRYLPASELKGRWHGQLSRACGLVVMRQRPPTANGVMFVTLEDETGHVNVILYPALVERQRQLLLHARLLAVVGTWQARDNTHHLLAGRLIDETHRLVQLVQSQEVAQATSHDVKPATKSGDQAVSTRLRSLGDLRPPY